MVVTESLFNFHDSSRTFKMTPLQFSLDSFLWYSEELFSRIRSSHQRCSVKEGVRRNLAKFAGKQLARQSFLIKYRTPLGHCFWKILPELPELLFCRGSPPGVFRRKDVITNFASVITRCYYNSQENSCARSLF